MAKATLNDAELGSVIRGKINDNFTELYDGTQFFAPISNNYFRLVDNPGFSSAGFAFGNVIYFSAFVVRREITISAIGAYVAAALGGANFQVAIYACSSAGLPTSTSLAQSANLSGATVGAVMETLGSNLTLSPGIYWFGCNSSSGAINFQSLHPVASPVATAMFIGTSTLGNIAGAGEIVFRGLTLSKTFGTWGDMTSESFTEVVNSWRGAAGIGRYA